VQFWALFVVVCINTLYVSKVLEAKLDIKEGAKKPTLWSE
jgi:hypothetical protein